MREQLALELGGMAETDVALAPGTVLLRGFACSEAAKLVEDARAVSAAAPFRHFQTPGGFRMSVAMTNCGGLGWTSDRSGYRYALADPASGLPWPPMPESFLRLARAAADLARFSGFTPDACLLNRYDPGTRLTLHQDKNEIDFSAPIVSVSLGLPATFLFGGLTRDERPVRVPLCHGDVMVWGGPSRLRYHGVPPLKDGEHPLVGPHRLNLTFRKAG